MSFQCMYKWGVFVPYTTSVQVKCANRDIKIRQIDVIRLLANQLLASRRQRKLLAQNTIFLNVKRASTSGCHCVVCRAV